MREIKFRQAIFKDGVFNHWHYWGYPPKDGYSSDEFVAPITIGQQSWNKTYEVKPSQQYTGLPDKSTLKEIYEGDIVRVNTELQTDVIKTVVYDNDAACFALVTMATECGILRETALKYYEVIGNIWENPIDK